MNRKTGAGCQWAALGKVNVVPISEPQMFVSRAVVCFCLLVCLVCGGYPLLRVTGREKVGEDFSSESWNQTFCNQLSTECGIILECLFTELDPWPAATPLRLFSFFFLFSLLKHLVERFRLCWREEGECLNQMFGGHR